MAKAGKTRQTGEAAPWPARSIAQFNAVDALVGVSRQAVTVCRLYDPVFRAELNRGRREVWGASVDRLRALLPKALDCLEEALVGPDGWKAAVTLLNLAGLAQGGVAVVGPDTPDGVIGAEAAARHGTATLIRRPGEWTRVQIISDLQRDLDTELRREAPELAPLPLGLPDETTA